MNHAEPGTPHICIDDDADGDDGDDGDADHYYPSNYYSHRYYLVQSSQWCTITASMSHTMTNITTFLHPAHKAPYSPDRKRGHTQ